MKPLHIFIFSLFYMLPLTQNLVAQTSVISPNAPHCAFDEINHTHGQEIQQEIKDFLNNAIPILSTQERNVMEPLLSVAVVVHVIHEGEPVGTGRNISDEQVQAQIEILNEDFSSLNPQYFDTPGSWMGLAGTPNIQFCLANVDPDGNTTNGIDRVEMEVTGSAWNSNNINSQIKPATNWDPDEYLNIYVVSIPGTTAAGGVVGYSNYPTTSQVGSPSDGPVIDFNWFGAPNFPASGYRPLTHELGHFFGLPHTFNGNSCNTDDNIADTPDIEESTRATMQNLDCSTSYPAGPSSCGVDHLYVNYMDYVDENCYTSFTQGQVNVIRSVLDGTSNQFSYGSRESLLTNAPLLCNLPQADAGIVRLISPPDSYCTSDSISPEVTLRNFGVEDLTSVKILYRINGGATTEMDWQGSLFPGENTDLILPPFLPPNGEYTIEIFTENPNGQIDERAANDKLETIQFVNLTVRPPFVEDFEDETNLPTSSGFFGFNNDNDDLFWEVNQEVSGFGEGQTSVLIDNFAATGSQGTVDAFITRHFDLSDIEDAELRFDVAYAPLSSSQNDALQVNVSTGCSLNFSEVVYDKSGNSLATAPATSLEFTPTSTQWRTEIIDLGDFDGIEDIAIAFVSVSGNANRLFIDNFRIGRSCSSLSANWQTTDNGCGSTCDGSATITIPENNGGLNYSWLGWPASHNEATVNQLCTGDVTVTVTDALGCEIITTTEIQQAPVPQGNTESSEETTFGALDGSATVNVSSGTPPFQFDWSNGTSTNSSNFSNTIFDLSAGEYTVTVTDDTDCSSEFMVEVASVCGAFNASTPTTNVSCFGETDGSAIAFPLNGQAPFEYEWNNGATTQLNDNLPAGEYTVTVTDANECPTVQTTTVTQPDELILTATSTNETSANANDGSVSASADGGVPGYEYSWSNGSNMPTQFGLAPGQYTVTVTDLIGCQTFTTVSVQPFTCDDFNALISWENVTCFGFANGIAEVEVSGETPPVMYAWSNGETSAIVENLTADEYTVTVSDAAGCEAELVASVLQPAELFANASSTNETMPSGEDGTATVTPSGGLAVPGNGYEAMWSNNEMGFSIESLAPGFYYVTVTDANDCVDIDTVFVQAADCNLSIQTSITSASCPDIADGLAIVTEVPGGAMPLSYAWSNGDDDPFAENLLEGEYTVTVTDANGCSVFASVQVTADDMEVPTLNLIGEITLELDGDGLAFLNPDDVNDGSSDNCSMVFLELSQMEFDCDDLGETIVNVEGSDSSGNSASGEVTVNVVDLFNPTITCPDDLTVITCDTVFYDLPVAEDNCQNVDIQFIDGFEPGEIFPAGTTTVTYEAVDFSDNTSSCSFSVTVDYDLAADLAGTPPTCAGDEDGYIDVFIAGGLSPYQALWSHGGGSSNLPAGEYTVTVTDQNGCTISETIELEDPPAFSAEVVNVMHAVNINSPGSISLSISGGNLPWVLTWFKDGIEVPNFDPLLAPPGNYSVMIEDQNGCEILLEDIFVDNLNGVADRELDRQIDLFPNPTAGTFFVKISANKLERTHLSVFDVRGRNHLNQTFFPAQNQSQLFDLSELGSGVFWVKIQMGEAVAWRKVVVI